MAHPVTLSREALAAALRSAGVVSATDLAARLKVDRTTIVRALSEFGSEVVSMGATRSTRYALRRPIANIGSSWPIYRIDPSGRALLWAEVTSLWESQWRIIWAGDPPEWAGHFSNAAGLWQGFPFFLADLRPQGFLGRALARRLAQSLPLPPNPQEWSDPHTLLFLQAASEDLPGSLVVGDDCLRRLLESSVFGDEAFLIQELDRAERYPALASDAVKSPQGSSAGGEQPKFCATLQTQTGEKTPVLVKFSPPMNQLIGQRWADLLLAEWHALRLFSALTPDQPEPRLIDAGGRRFLEVTRFDRTAQGGRRGVVSLGALHPESYGYGHNAWLEAGEELLKQQLIHPETMTEIRHRHALGELIGNTDMHAGNLAFWLDDQQPFRLAPVYDMLPMLHAPGSQGEIIPRTFRPPVPLPAMIPAWQTAAPTASEFWENLSADPRLSPDFQKLAQAALTTLRTMRRRLS
jgi:hypothetical protein